MIVGFAMYCLSTLLCAISGNIYVFLLGRILQGVGAACVTAVSFAMINDCFVGKTRETILAIAQTLSGFGPVVAPVIGSWILLISSWRGTFVALLIFGVVGMIMTLMYEETVSEEDSFKGSIFDTFGQLKVVVKNKVFTQIVVTYAIIFMPLYAYLNLSSYIYVNQFGCTEQVYSYYHAFAALLSMVGPAIYIKFFATSNKNKLTYVSFGLCAVAGIVMMTIGTASPVLFCGMVFIYYLMTNIVRPYSTNLILSQNPSDVGSSSSVMNMSYNILAVVGMLLATFSFENMVGALGVILLVCSVVSILIWWKLAHSGKKIRLLND